MKDKMRQSSLVSDLKNLYEFLKNRKQSFPGAEELQAQEFSALFEGTDASLHLDLWESAWLGEGSVLMNSVTLQVLKVYYAAGVCPVRENEPGDSLLLETEFLLYLLHHSTDGETERTAASFALDHFLPLGEKVFAQMALLEDKREKAFAQMTVSGEKQKKKKEQPASLKDEQSRKVFAQTEVRKEATENKAEWQKKTALCRWYKEQAAYFTHVLQEMTAFFKDILQGEKGVALQQEISVDASLWSDFRPVSSEEIRQKMEKRVVTTCGRENCGGRCQIMAHVQGGCITDLGTDQSVVCPLRSCVKGRSYRHTFLTPKRLKYPMLRVGQRGDGVFKRISWEEAVELMAEKLAETKEKYGPGCRFVNYATGTSSVVYGNRMLKKLLALDGGYLNDHNTYSAACLEYTTPYIYGSGKVGSSCSNFYPSKLLILWGYNPAVTYHNARIMDVLKYHKEQGTPIICIDPRFSDTAAVFATKWLPLRPGTDAALAAAMAFVLWDEGMADQAFMDKYCLGMDPAHMPEGYEKEESYRDYIFGTRDGIRKDPAWAEQITGLPREEIYALARAYGLSKPAAIISGYGLQRHSCGELTIRAIAALPCLTGMVGRRGGGSGFDSPTFGHKDPVMEKPANPYPGSISSFLWTEAILRGHEMTAKKDHIHGMQQLDSDIKILFNLAGNCLINQHGDINRTAQILKDTGKCEFIVVSDLFMTSSARYADLLLPGTSVFESETFSTPWRDDNFLLYGCQAIEPLFEARAEIDWINELSEKLGYGDLSEGTAERDRKTGRQHMNLRKWHGRIYEKLRQQEPELPEYEQFVKEGGYRYKNTKETIAFQEQIADPETHPFATPSGKIEIFCPALFAMQEPEIPGVPKYMPAPDGYGDALREKYPLQLVGWHSKRRTHSIHDQNPWLEQMEPHRLWLHPEDAAQRGLAEGDMAEIFNDRGRVQMKVHLTRRIMKGVTAMSQGGWYTPDEKGVDHRGSINVLTSSYPTPLAKGNSQHSILVEIRKC